MANSRGGDDPESTPICRCRVLYLGSAVPHVTKDGLQGIQEPLRELYPEQGALGARGIDSWLSVWSNGLLLENVDENHKKVTRFFPIDSLHYCAAVRYVLVPERAGAALGGGGGGGTLLSSSSSSGGGPSPRFLPLDSPFARTPNPSHPPLFAAILRRTTGIKVLECHAFICKREMAANALVRCCFHAYADSSYARHIDGSGGGSAYGTLRSTQGGDSGPGGGGGGAGNSDSWRRSTLSLNHHSSAGAGGTLTSNASAASALSGATDDVSIYNGDENHKVWVGSGTLEREEVYGGGSSTVRSSRSQRPRQVVAPVSAPPPPPTPKEEKASKKAAANTKERNRRKKLLGGSVDNLMLLNGMSGGGSLLRPHSSMSGGAHHHHHHHHHHHQQPHQSQHRLANGSGSLLRHANGYHHPHPHHYAPAGPPPPGPPLVLATLPGRPKQAKAKAGGGKVVLQPVPLLAPVAAPHHPGTGRRRHAPGPGPVVLPVEEPVYMPSARPMSPVASFQPAHFPHEAYLMQQYATVEHPGRHAKKKAAKHKGAGPVVAPPPAVVPIPVSMPVQPPPPHVLVNGGGASPDEDEIAVLAEESTSPFNTGIYRKKGHLNERAFSYSIRQEHRSRSYGSLANLKFSGPDLKKEREIAQMMQDLELSSGDELERSDVPPTHQRGSLRTSNVRR
ncbi:uncharacterized protein LOC126203219 isoform X1 [Schistocerca nitens]|uniref:uncharacterized protein LOC126203219 isoform X1 n=1 Tax=Schistocerca nitens TaxID=7011 RepID=UPI0021178C16|nr:uncharacterized protein LOC126203219 isoform X1 [Schistocerca nitens]